MNGNEKLERELEFFLREDDSRVAALYRKLPRPEPDAKIDAAVLAMARRAARPPMRVHNHRWLPALSAAAAILLAASVAIRVGPQIWNSHSPHSGSERDEQAITRQMQEPATPAPPAAASPATPATSLLQPPPPMPAAKIVAPMLVPLPAKPVQRFDLEKSRAAAPAAAAMPTPNPQSMPQESSADRVDKDQLGDRKSRTPPVPQQAQAEAFPAAPVDSHANKPSIQNGGSATQKQERRQDDSASDSAVGAAAGPRANAPVSTGTVAPLAAAKRSRARNSDAHDRLIRNSHLYPESWIAAIRRLIHGGHKDEARDNLDYFRKKYPDYDVPADLERFAERTK